MFGDKKNENEKILPGHDLLAENIPVHTMQKDLEEIMHPERKFEEIALKNVPRSISESKVNIFRPSPFLDKPLPPKQRIEGVNQRIVAEPKTEDFLSPKKGALLPPGLTKQKLGLARYLLVAAIILITIITGASAYYFWTTRQANPPEEIITNNNENNETGNTVPAETPVSSKIDVPKFSIEQPNHLNLDIATATPESIKAILQNNIKELKDSKIVSAVEFVIVDMENKPIKFSSFAEKFGIVFPKSIMSSLKDVFSLFIYNDNENYRLGFTIERTESPGLQKLMLAEEPKLPTDLNPIFLDIAYSSDAKKKFSTSNYDNFLIRYNNIVSPEYLSVDYAFSESKLILGTTKITIRAVIDKISGEKPEAQAAKNEVLDSPQQPEQAVDNSLKAP